MDIESPEELKYYPLKYDWHKNKNNHTLRHKDNRYNIDKNPLLETFDNLNKKGIPITIIDEYCNNHKYTEHFNEIILNQDYLWTNVENILETESIRTGKKWIPESGTLCRTYDIPVKKYVPEPAILTKELSWLNWNNKYYDPNYLYDDITLTPYCPLKWIEPNIDDNLESNGKHIFTQRINKKK